MLYVPSYTRERRPYSVSVYPTSFTLNSLLALRIRSKKNLRLVFHLEPLQELFCIERKYVLGV